MSEKKESSNIWLNMKLFLVFFNHEKKCDFQKLVTNKWLLIVSTIIKGKKNKD